MSSRWCIAVLLTVLGACEDEVPCVERAGHVCVVAGTGELGFNRDGLAAVDTDLFLVSAARRGPDGRTYVMDFNNHRLRVIDTEGRMQTLAGNGFHELATVEVPAVETGLENPIDFAFFGDGRAVFTSYHDPRVLVLDHDGVIRVVAGTGELGVTGDEGDGGPALGAAFIQLDGIVVGPDDTIWVSDSLANRVRRIHGGTITTVAGTGVAGYDGDGGPAESAALQWPTALALDRDGNLLVADTFNHVVRRVGTDGVVSTVAGSGVGGFGGDGGPATAARLHQPYGVAVGPDGTLYISDRGNFRVRQVDRDGVISTLAGDGREGMRDGPAAASSFAYVARIAIDDDGLLVADQSNSVVRRVSLE